MIANFAEAFRELWRDIREIKDRCRRMETRFTKFLESQGFDTQVKPPVWTAGRIDVPSISISLKDVLAVVPEDWRDGTAITITLKGEEIAVIYTDTPTRKD